MASVPFAETFTGLVYQPLWSGVRPKASVTFGAVASRLITTCCEDVPPALVAEHVNVIPAVSVVTELAPQPVVDVTVLWASVTLQLTLTSLVYQLLLPSVPETFATITGGVESAVLKCAYSLNELCCPGMHVVKLWTVLAAVVDQYWKMKFAAVTVTEADWPLFTPGS
jgi:hypothetical protein